MTINALSRRSRVNSLPAIASRRAFSWASSHSLVTFCWTSAGLPDALLAELAPNGHHQGVGGLRLGCGGDFFLRRGDLGLLLRSLGSYVPTAFVLAERPPPVAGADMLGFGLLFRGLLGDGLSVVLAERPP